jgi:hypothetical protein
VKKTKTTTIEKAPIELEERETEGAMIDLKVGDDVLSPDELTEDLEADELGLDDEEVDPFGDKWEA